jgi:beta-carotene hydroxylase
MSSTFRKPPLAQLGRDLLRLSRRQLLTNLALPFVFCGCYFPFASLGHWPAAVLSLIGLSFFTYGSTSHDLVHRNLRLSARVNDVLLCVIELLGLRSGHAYQMAHLHHHARFPADDDIEATAAGKSWLGAVLEGFTFQPRIWFWAYRRGGKKAAWVVGEGIACLALLIASAALMPVTPIFAIYAGLMIAGSWIIPLITARIPHDPHGEGVLSQTRLFRGFGFSLIGLQHLYHLEHHLYPAVPHQNWPKLARRLNPLFEAAAVREIRIAWPLRQQPRSAAVPSNVSDAGSGTGETTSEYAVGPAVGVNA